MNQVKRPVNYYGSKDRMCSQIHALIPDGVSTWVDMFCGSAIVTLRKPRHRREVINDLNDDIINLFDVLRSGQASALYEAIELTPFSDAELRRVYHTPESGDPIEKARRFLICSWFGRGGDIHKTGLRWSKGQTVAPELAWARLPDRLIDVAERLRGICIRSTDALKIVDDYDSEECLLFADPPYPGAVGRRYRIKMSNAQHEDLARRLCEARAKVIVTMSLGTIYDDYFKDWCRHASRLVNNAGNHAEEVIFTNFEPRTLFSAAE